MLHETTRTIERMTEWFLRNEDHPLDIRQNIQKYRPGVETLRANLEDILGPIALDAMHRRNERFDHDGVPAEVVARVGQLKTLSAACDVVKLAAGVERPVDAVGRTYTHVGQRFGLDWLRSVANRLPSDNQWHRLAVAAIIDDLWGLQAEIAAKVMRGGKTGDDAIDAWVETRGESADRVDGMLTEFRQIAGLDLAMLAVVNRELRSLAGSLSACGRCRRAPCERGARRRAPFPFAGFLCKPSAIQSQISLSPAPVPLRGVAEAFRRRGPGAPGTGAGHQLGADSPMTGTGQDTLHARRTLDVGGKSYDYYSLSARPTPSATSRACPSR